MDWGIVAFFAVTGAFCGGIGSRVLSRAGRPVVVSPGWCAGSAALLWCIVAWRWTSAGFPGWWLPMPLVVTALAPPLVLADLGHRRLPDVLTLPAYVLIALAVSVATVAGAEAGMAVRAVLAAGVFGGIHALVHAVAPAALGAGDVKLSGSLGAVLGASGWPALVIAACLAALTAVGLSLVAAGLPVRRWSSGVPYGPGLLAATCLIVMFPGADLMLDPGS